MPSFPISQADAAGKLKISASEASVIVRLLDIPTAPSPQNARAKMLDVDGYRRLQVAAKKLRVVAAIESRRAVALSQ